MKERWRTKEIWKKKSNKKMKQMDDKWRNKRQMCKLNDDKKTKIYEYGMHFIT